MIAICCDSTSGLDVAGMDALPVPHAMVRLSVILGESVVPDEPGVVERQLAAHMRGGGAVSTSMPSAADFAAAYAALAGQADEIVSIHLSGELSGTADAAREAAGGAAVPVHIADAGITAAGLGATVRRAALQAASGEPGAGIAADAAAWARESTFTLFLPETLEYLRRGGRIGRASHLIGQALRVQPVLGFQDGTVAPVAKIRTRSKALSRMCATAAERAAELAGGGTVVASVQHLDTPEEAEALAARLQQHAEKQGVVLEAELTQLSAVVGAHAGPGVLGVSLWPRF